MAVIDIKGQNNSLVFQFSEAPFEAFTEFLNQRFQSNPMIFKGMAVSFRGEGLSALSQTEIADLQRLCLDNGMVMAFPPAASKPVKEQPASKDLIVRKRLRSGQRVTSDGSIIVIGDVHESAEVMAGKDVIVLGSLEGVVHAGCFGDEESIVFALNLYPRQIRIGEKISRLPSDYQRNRVPEIAFIDGEHICVEAYDGRSPRTK